MELAWGRKALLCVSRDFHPPGNAARGSGSTAFRMWNLEKAKSFSEAALPSKCRQTGKGRAADRLGIFQTRPWAAACPPASREAQAGRSRSPRHFSSDDLEQGASPKEALSLEAGLTRNRLATAQPQRGAASVCEHAGAGHAHEGTAHMGGDGPRRGRAERGRRQALVALSFSGAIGLTFLMLGCALEDYGVYWPLFVLVFHAVSPLPHCITKRVTYDSDAASSACRELAYFFTTGIVVSAFGFPVILARVAVIKWGACGLVLAGNAVIFLTIQGFFLVFGRGDDFSWEQW